MADGSPGGATTLIFDMLNHFQNHLKFSCSVITESNSYAFRLCKKLGVNVKGLNFFYSRLNLKTAYLLHKEVISNAPDLIHVHGGRAAFFLSLFSRKTPTVYTVHGLHGLYSKSRCFRMLTRLAEKKSMKSFSQTVFVSKTEKSLAEKEKCIDPFHQKSRVILNGISSQNFPKANPCLKRLGFIGRFCEQKDPVFVIEVLRILASKGFSLIMIGGGSLEHLVRNKIFTYGLEKTVLIKGAISRSEALSALSQVEMLLMPSLWEGLSIALIEAMAMGVPVIASKIPSIQEVIQHGETGVLVSEKNPNHYAEAILNLYSQPKKKEKIIQQAQKHIGTHFMWSKYIDDHKKLYEELVESK